MIVLISCTHIHLIFPGLLCVTCTDMQVLCGNYAEVCFYKYGSLPLKGKATHEHAVRILLAALERSASKYRRHIVPLISLSMDFYLRVFVRVYSSPEETKRSMTYLLPSLKLYLQVLLLTLIPYSKLSHVYQCIGCDSLHFQPLGKCEERGNSKKFYPTVAPVVNKECDECGRPFRVSYWKPHSCGEHNLHLQAWTFEISMIHGAATNTRQRQHIE